MGGIFDYRYARSGAGQVRAGAARCRSGFGAGEDFRESGKEGGMIYLVEDDNSIRELVIYTLANSGFEAQGIRSAFSILEGGRQKSSGPHSSGYYVAGGRRSDDSEKIEGQPGDEAHAGDDAHRKGQRIR